jgi:hypothetical protein
MKLILIQPKLGDIKMVIGGCSAQRYRRPSPVSIRFDGELTAVREKPPAPCLRFKSSGRTSPK